MSDELDWEGCRVKDFIGRRIDNPAGEIIGGYVDGVGIMLFEVRDKRGLVHNNIPRTVVHFVKDSMTIDEAVELILGRIQTNKHLEQREMTFREWREFLRDTLRSIEKG